MTRGNRILSLLLAVVMVLGMLPVTALAEGFARTAVWQDDLFTDVKQEDWFYENVRGLYELGLMIGYGNGLFQPDNSISMAETLTVAARIHAVSANGEENFLQEDPWYQVYADYAREKGLVDDLPEDMGRQATRLEFAHILARTMPEEDLAAINDVPDGSIPDLAEDAAVYLLYRAGVLMGDDEAGTFRPDANIKRSEVAAIVTRMILPELRHGAQTPDGEETDPTETQPQETTEPMETEPAETEPVETEPVETEPAETEPVETEPAETEPVETEPVETEPEETEPVETEPAETEPESGVNVSADIELDETGAVKTEVALEGTDAKAVVPAGVAAQEGAEKLTLTVAEMEATTGNITLEDAENLSSYDVHIAGVAADNRVPILVELGMALEPGFNLGNVTLYHVEDGVTNPMTQVMTLAEVDAHNEFYYDPATGVLTMALATFSEIAVVAEEAKWEGEFDYSWYDADETELTIANADQLAAFGAIVGGMAADIEQDSFSGKTVKLVSDINLGDQESENNPDLIFYPIGYNSDDGKYEKTDVAVSTGFYTFEGIFDGNGHTVSNFYQNTWEMKGDNNYYDATLQYYRDGMGLFGKIYGGTVKNLTVENFSSDGEYTTTGVIAAYADCGATFENIAIVGCNPRVYNIGNGGIVGCVGWYAKEETDEKVTFSNITVDNSNKISALWGSYDVACGGIVGQYYPTSGQTSAGTPKNAGIHFENCHVAAQMDVYNDVCANYQYYAYRYTGMMIGSIRENETIDGHVYPKMDGITASGCTVHFGDWNDYYYCELVANSLASYTHDHQMSRLEQVKAVDGTTVTPLEGEPFTVPDEGRYNYVVVKAKDADGKWIHGDGADYATCYHFVNGAVHKHDVADTDNPDPTETVDGVEGVLKEDKQLVYREFDQLFTGYGWGVTSKGIGDLAGITILDREVADSVVKFKKADTAKDSYTTGTEVEIRELFAAIENTEVEIKNEQVVVTVSPADAESTAGGAFNSNPSDWSYGTLSFSGAGAATITIQDYYFCTPTTINVEITEPEFVEKFAANTIDGQDAYTQITLGDLFTAKDGVTIGNVTATVTDPSGSETTVTGISSDWADKTIDLIKDGTWTVVIKDNDEYCTPTTVTFAVNKVDKFTNKFDKDFLYRVGNKNEVTLGTIFEEISTVIALSSVNVTIENVAGNAAGTFTSNATWANGTIQFSGTGVVKVTISADGANKVTLNLEVVDAYNRTTASFGGNSVLLNDVSTSSAISTSGVIYGNGFTVNMENAPISEKNGAVFHLYDGAVLKNLGIVGKEFTTVAMNVNDTNYGVSAVRAWGTVTIENCYISGCRSAVSVTGTELTIKDSVIANGIYANIDFRSGILNLHNVTTVNEPHTVNGTTVLGLGIVGNMTASAGREINITGTLTQYNWVSQADCNNIKASGVSSIFTSVFTEDKYASLRYTYDGTTYVNTGILSLCSDFGASAVTGAPSHYSGMNVTATISSVTVDGYVWAPGRAGTLTDADMAYHDKVYEWTPSNQGTSYIPSAFDYTAAGLETDNGVVQISYESGNSYTLSADTINTLLSPKKYGKNLSYTVTMNEVDYTGKDIVFDATASQTYTITYTITDNLVYGSDGALTDTTYKVTKDLKVFATVVDKGADAPTFTFYYGTNGSASAGTPHTTQPTSSYTSTIKQIGETYYIMPNVSATENAIGSQTVDGETVYYPIVDGINVRSGSSTDYDFTRYYPVFKAVKISDNGTEYSYDGTTEMPATVAWVSATIDSGNGASALNDGFGLYNNQYLCKIQKKAGDAESGGTSVVKFSYTALDGNTYCYYVGYRFYDESEGCITPDTLVTLADGSQVRVDSLTGSEELLVWNLETGKLDSAPIMFVDSDPEAEFEIVHLYFSDGTDVKVIYEHGFWDYDLNKYVYLDANAADYIGHTFAKQNGDALEKVQLADVVIETEVTTAWSPVTEGHLCYFVNGMLSMPGGVGGLFNIFDVDPETMTYDYEAMQKDIETYGLYTYEELNAICPLSEEMFNAAGGAYLKVSIGKGNLTMEELTAMINRYSPFFA